MQTERHEDPVLALFLAAIAGCVDAVAFIELGGFFVASLGGTSTRLGLALGQQQWALAGFAAGLVALFVGGAALGQAVGSAFGTRRKPVLLTLLAVLLAAAATLYGRGGYGYAPPLMALAMGLSHMVLARDGTVSNAMTTTLARIGGTLAQGNQPGAGRSLLIDLSLVIVFVAGALGGASGETHMGGTVLEVPAIAAMVLALWRWTRR